MITLSAIVVSLLAVQWCFSACPPEYAALRSDHTMCLTDRGKEVDLSNDEIKNAVDRHNEIRAEVSPPAADMQQLVWDDNLAKVAGKWARQCNFTHDTNRRDEPALPGVYIGQNMAAGYASLVAAIEGWHTEKASFKYGSVTGGVVGHYTQIVFARTTRVGCGVADCTGFSKYKWFQVCNYAIGQMGANVASQPYTKSDKSCSACQDHCVAGDKLCGCGGKLCYNGGKLSAATCQCDCPSSFSGDSCQTKNCPADTKWMCDIFFGNPEKYTADPCTKYTNVRTEICPNRCGFC